MQELAPDPPVQPVRRATSSVGATFAHGRVSLMKVTRCQEGVAGVLRPGDRCWVNTMASGSD
jgi:hypothetical protein